MMRITTIATTATTATSSAVLSLMIYLLHHLLLLSATTATPSLAWAIRSPSPANSKPPSSSISSRAAGFSPTNHTKGMSVTLYSTKDGCSTNARPSYFVYSYNGNAITQDACHTLGNSSENHVNCVYFEKGGRLGPLPCGPSADDELVGLSGLENAFTGRSLRISRNYCYVWSEPGCPVSASEQALLHTGLCHDGLTVRSFRCNWMNETTSSSQQQQLGDASDDGGVPTAPAGSG